VIAATQQLTVPVAITFALSRFACQEAIQVSFTWALGEGIICRAGAIACGWGSGRWVREAGEVFQKVFGNVLTFNIVSYHDHLFHTSIPHPSPCKRCLHYYPFRIMTTICQGNQLLQAQYCSNIVLEMI
jgi:hypothetical protein